MRDLAPPGYVLRSAVDDDIDDLVEFLRVCTATHLGGERASREEVDDRLHQPGSDPERDTVLVVDADGKIAGFAHSFTEPPHEDVRCFARVSPLHTGRGVGRALLTWAVERGRALAFRCPPGPLAVLHVTQWAKDSKANALLDAAGFRHVRSLILMQAELSDTPAAAELPAGVSIRDCANVDELDPHRTHAEAFATHWGRTELDLARWLSELTSGGRYDADLWRLAFAGDVIVGFALALADMPEHPGVGYVQNLGVIPAWRGRGLGLALLVDVFDAMRRRGITHAALHVDAENETGAVSLYRRASMVPEPGVRIWEQALRAESPLGSTAHQDGS